LPAWRPPKRLSKISRPRGIEIDRLFGDRIAEELVFFGSRWLGLSAKSNGMFNKQWWWQHWPWVGGGLLLIGFIYLSFVLTGLTTPPERLLEDPRPATHLQTPQMDPGKISLWVDSNPTDAESLKREIAEYERQTGRGVQLGFYDTPEEYRAARDAAIADGNPPDVFLVSALDATSLARGRHLLPLGFGEDINQEWLPSTIHPFRHEEGGVVAIPCEFSILVVYYNKKHFDREGIAYPYPGDHWNWDSLLAFSKKLYRPPVREGSPPSYGIEMPLSLQWWNALASQAGGGLYAEGIWQLGETNFLAAQNRGFDFLHLYFRNLAVAAPPLPVSNGFYFLQGRAALLVAGSEIVTTLEKQSSIEWGVAPLPRAPQSGTALEVHAWAVSTKTIQPDLAAQLAFFLASRPCHSTWLPARQAPELLPHSPARQVFYDEAPNGQPPPRLTFARSLEDYVNRNLPFWIKQKKPETKAIFAEINALVKNHGEPPNQTPLPDGEPPPSKPANRAKR
jgi:ABC-type glycerol-3-phosphate transport system substrate-binding protein